MKSLEKEMKEFANRQLSQYQNEDKIRETILKSQQAFCEKDAESSLSWLEFLYQQSRFIRKRWWLIQGFLLVLLWWILTFAGSTFDIRRSMGVIVPMFVVLIVPELWKNRTAMALEIECTTYYSLRQVYAARMFIFALVDLSLLGLFFSVAAISAKLTMGEIITQFFLTFNVTCSICFRTLCSKKFCSEFLALLLCMVWAAVWVQIVLNERIYDAIFVPIQSIMMLLSVLYLGSCIFKLQKNCQKIWEVSSTWN